MSLERKLKEWEAAGLIDAALRARLAAYEEARSRPVLLYALGGLGAFTIATGIVSIVATNWDALGKAAKLSADLMLALGLAGLLYWAVTTGRRWQTDVIAGVYYGFTLASIALLGQIYQLGAPMHQALLLWSLLTLPMMTLIRGRFLGLVWLAGLLTTHGSTLAFWLEELEQTGRLATEDVGNLAVLLAAVSWALYLFVARVPAFLRRRSVVAQAWSEAVWLLLLALGAALCIVFYSDIGAQELMRWGPIAAVLVLSGVHLALPRLYPSLPLLARHGLSAGLLALSAILLSCASFVREAWPAAGALFQVALLAVAAFVVLQLGRVRSFNLLTALIGLRVLVMYFEVFGSMLDTGLGMITGGALTVALAWLWKRKSPELAARIGKKVPLVGGPDER